MSKTAAAQTQNGAARLGVLMLSESQHSMSWHMGMLDALRHRGWDSNSNLKVHYAFARGEEVRFDKAALDLVEMKVDVILAISTPAVAAAHRATRTTPIVAMDFSADPIAAGYARSYAQPGGNLTGVFLNAPGLAAKWMEIMRVLRPAMHNAALLWNPAVGPMHVQAARQAADKLGIKTRTLEVRTQEDIDRQLQALPRSTDALLVLPSPLTYHHSTRIAEHARKKRVPAISLFRDFAEQGGAVAYGPVLLESAQRCAAKVASILDGAKPGALSLESPMRFDFVYNMSTLRAFGIDPPQYFLLGADMIGK